MSAQKAVSVLRRMATTSAVEELLELRLRDVAVYVAYGLASEDATIGLRLLEALWPENGVMEAALSVAVLPSRAPVGVLLCVWSYCVLARRSWPLMVKSLGAVKELSSAVEGLLGLSTYKDLLEVLLSRAPAAQPPASWRELPALRYVLEPLIEENELASLKQLEQPLWRVRTSFEELEADASEEVSAQCRWLRAERERALILLRLEGEVKDLPRVERLWMQALFEEPDVETALRILRTEYHKLAEMRRFAVSLDLDGGNVRDLTFDRFMMLFLKRICFARTVEIREDLGPTPLVRLCAPEAISEEEREARICEVIVALKSLGLRNVAKKLVSDPTVQAHVVDLSRLIAQFDRGLYEDLVSVCDGSTLFFDDLIRKLKSDVHENEKLKVIQVLHQVFRFRYVVLVSANFRLSLVATLIYNIAQAVNPTASYSPQDAIVFDTHLTDDDEMLPELFRPTRSGDGVIYTDQEKRKRFLRLLKSFFVLEDGNEPDMNDAFRSCTSMITSSIERPGTGDLRSAGDNCLTMLSDSVAEMLNDLLFDLKRAQHVSQFTLLLSLWEYFTTVEADRAWRRHLLATFQMLDLSENKSETTPLSGRPADADSVELMRQFVSTRGRCPTPAARAIELGDAPGTPPIALQPSEGALEVCVSRLFKEEVMKDDARIEKWIDGVSLFDSVRSHWAFVGCLQFLELNAHNLEQIAWRFDPSNPQQDSLVDCLTEVIRQRAPRLVPLVLCLLSTNKSWAERILSSKVFGVGKGLVSPSVLCGHQSASEDTLGFASSNETGCARPSPQVSALAEIAGNLRRNTPSAEEDGSDPAPHELSDLSLANRFIAQSINSPATCPATEAPPPPQPESTAADDLPPPPIPTPFILPAAFTLGKNLWKSGQDVGKQIGNKLKESVASMAAVDTATAPGGSSRIRDSTPEQRSNRIPPSIYIDAIPADFEERFESSTPPLPQPPLDSEKSEDQEQPPPSPSPFELSMEELVSPGGVKKKDLKSRLKKTLNAAQTTPEK